MTLSNLLGAALQPIQQLAQQLQQLQPQLMRDPPPPVLVPTNNPAQANQVPVEVSVARPTVRYETVEPQHSGYKYAQDDLAGNGKVLPYSDRSFSIALGEPRPGEKEGPEKIEVSVDTLKQTFTFSDEMGRQLAVFDAGKHSWRVARVTGEHGDVVASNDVIVNTESDQIQFKQWNESFAVASVDFDWHARTDRHAGYMSFAVNDNAALRAFKPEQRLSGSLIPAAERSPYCDSGGNCDSAYWHRGSVMITDGNGQFR
jgi:hypothetical protein